MVGKNFLILFLSQGFGKVTGLLFGFVAARLLGTVGFGNYAVVYTFVSYSLVITEFGLSPLMVRDMCQRPEERFSILASGMALRFGLAILSVLSIVLLGISLDLSVFLLLCLVVGGLGTVLYAWNSALTDLLTSQEKLRYAAFVDMGVQIVFLGAVIGLLLISANILSVFIALLLANGLRAILLGYLTRQEIRRLSWRGVNLAACGNLLRKALDFGVLGLLGMLLFKIDILILYAYHPGSAVGLYEGAYRFLEAAMVLGVSLMTAMFPMLSRMSVSPSGGLHAAYVKATKFLLLSSFGVALILSLFAGPLIRFCYGMQFIPAIPLVPILMMALVIININAPYGRMLIALGKQRSVVRIMTMALVGNILLNFLLIPRWGAYGAAVSTVLTEIVAFLLFYPVITSLVGPMPWSSLLRVDRSDWQVLHQTFLGKKP